MDQLNALYIQSRVYKVLNRLILRIDMEILKLSPSVLSKERILHTTTGPRSLSKYI